MLSINCFSDNLYKYSFPPNNSTIKYNMISEPTIINTTQSTIDMSHILSAFIGAAIAKMLETFWPFIKEKIYTTQKVFCTFPAPKEKLSQQKLYDIEIIKKFNKTTDSNCPWWNLRKKIYYKDCSFYYCQFGIHIENIGSGPNKKCRHSKIKYKKIFNYNYVPKTNQVRFN